MWSPDERWLAVGVNYMARNRAILIFDITQNDYPEVYETSMPEKEDLAWHVKRWDLKGNLVVLQEESTGKSLSVPLARAKIKQSEYSIE